MNDKLYYQVPSDEEYEEIKKYATELWIDIKGEFHAEKTDKIHNMKNVKDNFMYIVSMFDGYNQSELLSRLSPKTKKSVIDRIKSVNN